MERAIIQMSLELPELLDIDINNYSNEIDNLYQIYTEELYNPVITILDKTITCRRNPLDDDKHECFWHLITEGNPDRTPDFERIRRLHWCAFILNNYTNPEISCWEKLCKTSKGSQIRVFFWLENEKYLIVLGENRKKTSFELITAYYVTNPGTLRSVARDCKICKDPR